MGWIAAALAAILLTIATPAVPAAAAADEYVLYYTVTASYQGQPENLAGIASRFLGDAGRATEVFNLNTGRRQPDGGALSDPNQLTNGWYLVLPWDAVGPGVQYGVLPTTAPAPAPAPAPGGSGAPANPANPANPGNPANPPGSPGGAAPSGAPASPRPSGGAKPPESGKCVAATAASSPSNWAMTRVASDLAWPYTRGTGVSVAVIDSGVDGQAPQLLNRVQPGVNVVTGENRGDTDCLGTGTAMAGLIAAQAAENDPFTGVAPDSIVLPIRVVTDGATAAPAAQAAAIDVALQLQPGVLALGSYVDITADPVVQSVQKALDLGIPVVAAAPTTSGGVTPPEDVILVGGVGMDGKLAEEYAAGTVEVVAPGVNVSSLGINGTTFVGTGTQYAVAMTAGTVALIRGYNSNLNPKQVAHRLQATSAQMGDGKPDPRYGHGMINPEAAVTRELPEEATLVSSDNRDATPVSGSEEIRIAFLLTVLAGLVLTALLVLRFRRTMRAAAAEDDLDDDWPAGDPPVDKAKPTEPSSAGSH
ncbi:hypothetical protein JCM9533A_62930 [Catenuloplanes niger JCM 9533]